MQGEYVISYEGHAAIEEESVLFEDLNMTNSSFKGCKLRGSHSTNTKFISGQCQGRLLLATCGLSEVLGLAIVQSREDWMGYYFCKDNERSKASLADTIRSGITPIPSQLEPLIALID